MSAEMKSIPQPPGPPYPIHQSVINLLSPQYVAFYNKYLVNVQQNHYQSIAISRMGKVVLGGGPGLPVGKTQDIEIPRQESVGPPVPVRCFTPASMRPPSGWPCVLYLHGGGWVLGDIDTENTVCTNMCSRAKCVVVTTDYRLAPEHPYPAAVEDSWEAVLWTMRSGVSELDLDLSKLAMAGSSAGANLAAAITQRAVTRPEVKIDFKVQLLVVPATDNTATPANNPTWRQYEYTAALPALKMQWYRNHYLPEPDRRSEPEASPLFFAAKNFHKLPPAVVLVGEVDMLRHEGEQYAKKLEDAGVPVRLELMKGMPHPFLAMDAVLDEGQRAISILCESLVQAFA